MILLRFVALHILWEKAEWDPMFYVSNSNEWENRHVQKVILFKIRARTPYKTPLPLPVERSTMKISSNFVW